jgi:hypothetical protein
MAASVPHEGSSLRWYHWTGRRYWLCVGAAGLAGIRIDRNFAQYRRAHRHGRAASVPLGIGRAGTTVHPGVLSLVADHQFGARGPACDEAATALLAEAAQMEEALSEYCLAARLHEKAWSHRLSAASCWAQPETSTRPLPGATTCWPRPASLTPFATALRSMSNNSALAGHASTPIWRPTTAAVQE